MIEVTEVNRCVRKVHTFPLVAILALITLGLFPVSAMAGHYTASLTGGSVTYDGQTYPNGTSSDALASGHPEHVGTTTAGVSSSGTITTTFTWQPDNTFDLPPQSAIVHENSEVAWSIGSGTTTGSGTCAHGLTSTMINIGFNQGNGTGQTIQADGYRIVTNPGASFTITANPSASVTGAAIPQGGGGYGGYGQGSISAGIYYQATAVPVVMNLNGPTIDSSGGRNILIGQGCQGRVSSNIGTMTNLSWSVSGDIFASWSVAADSSSTTYLLPNLNVPSPIWFWRSDSSNTVTATGDVLIYGVDLGTVTVTQSVTVWCPYYACAHNVGKVYIDTHQYGPMLEATNLQNPMVGIRWTGAVIPQDLFNSRGQGEWNFVQLIKPGRWHTKAGQNYAWTINGIIALDTAYPYVAPDTDPFPAYLNSPVPGWRDDDSTHYSQDSPGLLMDDTITNYAVNESFWTYMMYLPPASSAGVQWVPLHLIGWYWAANVNRPGNSWSGNPPPYQLPWYLGPVICNWDARSTVHPTWQNVISGSALYVAE